MCLSFFKKKNIQNKNSDAIFFICPWVTFLPVLRLRRGPSSWVLWACSSTSLWTPLTGSRPGGQTAARLWESSSTTAVMPSPQVEPGSVHQRDPYLCLQVSPSMVMVFNFFFSFFFHSFCCRGNLHLMWNWFIPQLDLLLWFHWDVHVLLRSLADLRVRDPPLWPVSLSNQSSQLRVAVLERSIICSSPLLSSPRPIHFRRVTSLCRVDVTEVQIAIIIMYLMSAFGGVSLWQAAVMDCYIFNTTTYGHTHTLTQVKRIQTATLPCTLSVESTLKWSFS